MPPRLFALVRLTRNHRGKEGGAHAKRIGAEYWINMCSAERRAIVDNIIDVIVLSKTERLAERSKF